MPSGESQDTGRAARLTRRSFLAGSLALPGALRPSLQDHGGRWQSFDVVVRLNLPPVTDSAHAWVPLPLSRSTPFQRVQGITTHAPGARLRQASRRGAAMLVASWPAADTATLDVSMRVATRDHQVSLTGTPASVSDAEAQYLRPTRLIPTDGIVREFADRITRNQRTPLARARAIYDWIVENTVRAPEVQGCGLGDIRWMLETRSLRGKCVDINALFVGLARAAGLPARDVYGLRVGPSRVLTSLGRTSSDVTTAQHCRAEVFITGHGWIPVDPADVRKAMLDEPGYDRLTDPRVAALRDRLFGAWEMNWIAFNDAHDIALPGAAGPVVPFLMYPQAEVDGVRRDSLDPAHFRYAITAGSGR